MNTHAVVVLLFASFACCLTMVKPEDLPVLETLNEYEEYAREHLDPVAWNYFDSSATYRTTRKNNEAYFQQIRLRPRNMNAVGQFDPSVTILGLSVSMPLGFDPVASQNLIREEGVAAVARAAQSANVIHIMSQFAGRKIADVRAAAPHAIMWQQVSLTVPRTHTLDVINEAEKNGFKAIVLTIDEPAFRISYGNLYTFPESYPNFRSNISQPLDITQSWEDVAWLKRQTTLPVVVKGLLEASQVKDAVNAGVDAIIVSNHGARVLDGAPATIEVLADIVDAVNAQDRKVEVYMDGGVRRGLDIYRALAIGAKMVFIGRPQLWGSIYNSTEGVLNVLDILRTEFVNTAVMSGSSNIHAINREMIVNPFQTEKKDETRCPTSGGENVRLSSGVLCMATLLLHVIKGIDNFI